MSDFERTALPKKLGIQAGARIAVLGAPKTFLEQHIDWPDGVRVLRSTRAPLDVALLFVARRSELLRKFPTTQRAMTTAGALWVVWPKRASRVVSDLQGDEVRQIGLAHGMLDNKVITINDSWSALRFLPRLSS